jgi:hypothetical protein
MQSEGVAQVAEQVLAAAEMMEVTLRTEQTVPPHLLKHFAKRIWELRAAIGDPDRALERLQQRIGIVQNNMEVLDYYRAGGFRFEQSWVSLPLLDEPDPSDSETDW